MSETHKTEKQQNNFQFIYFDQIEFHLIFTKSFGRLARAANDLV